MATYEQVRKGLMSSKINIGDRDNWNFVNALCVKYGEKMLDETYEKYVFRIANINGRLVQFSREEG